MAERELRVLHVINALGLGGGAEHSLAIMLPMLRERGIESDVAVLTQRSKGLEHSVREAGFDVTVLPGRMPQQIRSLRKLVQRTNIDVVHCTLFEASLVSRLALVGVGLPLINSFVNTSYDPYRLSALKLTPWKIRAVRLVDRLTARRIDAAHTITRAVGTEVAEVLRAPRTRITVIPRGRDSSDLGSPSIERRVAVRRSLGIGDTVPVVLNVGRQDSQKAQAALVEAFAEVRSALPDAVLLIAGREGDASPSIENALRRLPDGSAVRLLGHRDDVPDLLASADVFAFPSHYEGLGCSLLEAFALGVPVVGSDAAAIAEVLEDGALGVIVPRGDVSALGTALVDLLGDSVRRQRLSNLSHDRFAERYELDVVADATADFYRQVVAAGRHSRVRPSQS